MNHTDNHCHVHAHAHPHAHPIVQPTQSPSRRSLVIALASAAALSPDLVLAKSEATPADERFMRMALDEARQGDYAFGA
jgi:hypothetical protein